MSEHVLDVSVALSRQQSTLRHAFQRKESTLMDLQRETEVDFVVRVGSHVIIVEVREMVAEVSVPLEFCRAWYLVDEDSIKHQVDSQR